MSATITKYYSFDYILSHNAVYNFVVGARGLGKTYGAKRKAIKAFLKRGDQFVYTRRYKDDLKGRWSFFADIEHEFPEWEFRVNGLIAECAPSATRGQKKRDWKTMGYFVALSQAQTFKSVSFPKVTLVIFDEFIIEKGAMHYLPREAKAFNDLFSTIDRYQERTRVLFLANTVSIMNPYFLEYGIRPDEDKELTVHHDGFIACHFPESSEFQNEVYATKFGRFIQGTEYGEYAVGSQFHDNNDHLIVGKTGKARYKYTLETAQGVFSVWHDIRTDAFYVQKHRPTNELCLTLLPEAMREGWKLVTYNDKILQFLRASFRRGKVYFDTPNSRNAMIEVFKR